MRLIDADRLKEVFHRNVVSADAFDCLIDSAPTIDAVSKGVLEQFRWERDVAMKQLEEYGIPFCTNKDKDMVKVVRCKDCYHAEDDITHMFCVYFHHKVYEDDYCSNAVERREP